MQNLEVLKILGWQLWVMWTHQALSISTRWKVWRQVLLYGSLSVQRCKDSSATVICVLCRCIPPSPFVQYLLQSLLTKHGTRSFVLWNSFLFRRVWNYFRRFVMIKLNFSLVIHPFHFISLHPFHFLNCTYVCLFATYAIFPLVDFFVCFRVLVVYRGYGST